MSFWEIALIVACALFVAGVLVNAVIKKVKGKSGCGCDCSSCQGCSHSARKEKR